MTDAIALIIVRFITFSIDIAFIWFMAALFNPNIDSGMVWFIAIIFASLAGMINPTKLVKR